MAKYRIAITNVEYGCIDVEADSLDEAMEKAESFDGTILSIKTKSPTQNS